ncbi:MAG: glycoside hydrolase family 27 protein [Planctomycetota bacterium]
MTTITPANPSAALAAATHSDIHALTPTPPRGWNSFDCYGCSANEHVAAANLEAFAQRLHPHGYEYFVIDGGWFGEYVIPPGREFTTERHAARVRLDGHARLLPSRVSFPGGLQPLIDRAHALGIKFGLHLMRGIPRQAVAERQPIENAPGVTAADIADVNDTCGWCHYMYGVDTTHPAAQTYYDGVFRLFARWGVDFVKVDDVIHKPREIDAIATAIARCGRDMALSLSPGGDMSPEHLATYRKANAFRITADIWDRRDDIQRSFTGWEAIQGLNLGGVWPDLDMIPFGRLMVWNPEDDLGRHENLAGHGVARTDQFTPAQRRTFITQRAMAASPLFFGGELTQTDDATLRLVAHPEMLACNANGTVGQLVHRDNEIDVWFTPKRGSSGDGWIGIFNRDTQPRQGHIPLALLRDAKSCDRFLSIWTDECIDPDRGGIRFDLASDDVLFLRTTPAV